MPAADNMPIEDSRTYSHPSIRADSPMEGSNAKTRSSGDHRTESQAKSTSNSSRSNNEYGTRTQERQGSHNYASMTRGSRERDQGQEDNQASRGATTQTSRHLQSRRAGEREMPSSMQAPGSTSTRYALETYNPQPNGHEALTNKGSPHSISEDDEDDDGDAVMTSVEQWHSTSETVEQQNTPTPPPRPPRTQPTSSADVASPQPPPQPYPHTVTKGSSSASAQAAAQSAAQGLSVRQAQRGHGSGLEMEEAPVQQSPGSGLFNMAKSAIASIGSAPPRDRAKEAYDKLLSENQHLQAGLHRYKTENYHLRNDLQHLHGDLQRYREKTNSLTNELNHVYEDLEASRQLSDVRGKELLGAQVFLTKADMLSVSELTQKVTDLNDEIFQAAALLAEALSHQEATWNTDEERNVSRDFALKITGEPMLRALTNAGDREPNPLLVQLTLQIFLTEFCRIKLEMWYEGDENTNEFLGHIYNEIHKTEEQAVSGRWRAITHAKTRLSPDQWSGELIGNLNHILWVTSLAASPDSIWAFEQKLQPIFKNVLDLRVALGEQYTSADITPFGFPPDTPFDAVWMEDALSDTRSTGRGRRDAVKTASSNRVDTVAATCGIGLRQEIPPPARQASVEAKVTLRPKVILQSTLAELVQPPTRTSKSSRPIK
ncbi:hypothetical protein HYPSUDRAFT_815743 [Hypholoma sublateritium FD-334 SS-4]|uniref:Uncharacterized protein n=1 Tax=Hypholoma sublateritium (strain FD-334 SS-4) TaxID=945553 RepID=A0A0D2PKJ9_HYPSF|nr:hypothetical protein HYPSUDRAFT_815743 [Hypholoma sublateritium FD-334 SS-4]